MFPRLPIPITLLSLCLLALPLSASAERVNVTIDDTYGDVQTGAAITYSPHGAWKAGQTCTDCTARPDPARAYDRTWHDGTYNIWNATGEVDLPELTATVSFEGVCSSTGDRRAL